MTVDEKVRVGLRLPVPLAERLQQISDASGVSVPAVATALLAAAVAENPGEFREETPQS